MSKYSVGEREAAACNVQLDLQWGKTGLIMSCTLYTGGLPAANCCLHRSAKKKKTVQEACIRREGRSCCITWSNLTFHLWIGQPSAKKTLLLTAESSAKFFHLTCSRASLKHFLPWVLPLQPCREQTDPHESVEAQFLVKGAVDAAQPTSITVQPALPGSCSSLPWLSCGSSCRFWEDECAEGVCCSSLVCVLLGLNAVFWHNWLLIVLGSWDAGSASTWLNKRHHYVQVFPAQIILVFITPFPTLSVELCVLCCCPRGLSGRQMSPCSGQYVPAGLCWWVAHL